MREKRYRNRKVRHAEDCWVVEGRVRESLERREKRKGRESRHKDEASQVL